MHFTGEGSLLSMKMENISLNEGEEITERFTDFNFRQVLHDKGIIANPDKIYKHEVEQISTLDISDAKNKVQSIDGIEYFQDLRSLNCSDQQLIVIDLSHNKKIESLYCKRQFHRQAHGGGYCSLDTVILPNQYDKKTKVKFKSLDISFNDRYCLQIDLAQLPWLEYLNCSEEKRIGAYLRQRKKIDLSKNKKLKKIVCVGCFFSQLDLSNYKDLEELDCSYNNLDTIDISFNKKLRVLKCNYQWHQNENSRHSYNSTVIHTKPHEIYTALEELYCSENGLSEFDFAQFPNLRVLDCSKNKFAHLDLSNNLKLERIVCNTQIKKDHLYYTTNNDPSIEYGDTLSSIVLPRKKKNKIKTLICYGNKLETLDVSNCTKLDTLHLVGNKIKSLDLTRCINLTYLYCSNAGLAHLNVANCKKLIFLNCSANEELTELDLSNCFNLETLNCSYNSIISLDLSNNSKLSILNCRKQAHQGLLAENGRAGALSSLILPVSPHNSLMEIICDDNKLSTLDISHNKHLERLNCIFNKLQELDISHNSLLKEIDCRYNYIQDLDFSNNKQLTILRCGGQGYEWIRNTKDKIINLERLVIPYEALKDILINLDYSSSNLRNRILIEKLSALEHLNCSSCNITSIDLSKNKKLKTLSLSNNKLSKLDLSHNLELIEVNCTNNRFDEIDISSNKALERLNCISFNNENKKFTIYVGSDYIEGSINFAPNYTPYNSEHLVIKKKERK